MKRKMNAMEEVRAGKKKATSSYQRKKMGLPPKQQTVPRAQSTGRSQFGHRVQPAIPVPRTVATYQATKKSDGSYGRGATVFI